MSNIIDSIQLSGVTYQIQGSGGTETIELTQAQYDALVDKDPNVFYIITDAQAGDLTNYYTKTETDTLLGGKADTATTYTKTEVDTALAAKQTTLTAGTGISIVDNVISATGGGGGKAIEAGRGISITTGETADTVSLSLPISAGTGTNSIVEGHTNNKASGSYSHAEGKGTTASGSWGSHAEGASTTASGDYSHAEGSDTRANGNFSHAEGMSTKAYGNGCHSEGYGSAAGVENNINIQFAHAEGDHTEAKRSASHTEGSYTIANNWAEHASGRYNNSVSASMTFGDSGNTLFSVGNGTSDSARHNAFEIRQNGDIYITSGGTDIKLQDNLGGSNVPESRLNLLYGYGTSGSTDLFSWSTGSTSQVINEYVAFSKINNTSIICGKNTSPTNFSLVETSAITTSITSSSTDSQIPSAKAVYDVLGNIETLLSQI